MIDTGLLNFPRPEDFLYKKVVYKEKRRNPLTFEDEVWTETLFKKVAYIQALKLWLQNEEKGGV